jgi:rod shape-determining protein MreD
LNPFKIAAIVLINFILQSTVLNIFSVGGVVPNTGLMIVIAFSLISGKKTGAIVGLTTGLLQDMLFSGVIGINTLGLFSVGLLVGNLDQKVFKENLFLPFVITLLSTVFMYLSQFFFIYFLKIEVSLMDLILGDMIKELIYNGAVTVFVYKLILNNYKEPSVKFTKGF